MEKYQTPLRILATPPLDLDSTTTCNITYNANQNQTLQEPW